MKFLTRIAVAMLCIWASNANAVVTVKEQIMQSGQFAKKGCQADPKDVDYDECTCDADIRYPELVGMNDIQTQSKLNAWFKEQASKAVCEGDKIASLPAADATHSGKAHMSLSVHYEPTFSSEALMAFKFTDWAYTGGAHGNGSVIGVIADLTKGKILEPNDVFSVSKIEPINQKIYDVLSAKPEEEIFRDQIESRKGAFLKDGECQGCTLTLTPEGVHVLFQTYEVAPYGAGNTDVLIPTQYVGYPAVKEALLTEKQSMPEKN